MLESLNVAPSAALGVEFTEAWQMYVKRALGGQAPALLSPRRCPDANDSVGYSPTCCGFEFPLGYRSFKSTASTEVAPGVCLVR